MEHYIKQLIQEGEHQQLDFKFEVSDAKKIARSLAAFANTDGGRLLIGVKDNGKITGVRSDEEVYMIETAAHLYTKPEVDFTTEKHVVDGKIVVEVRVEPSTSKPHFAPDKNDKLTPYIRVKDNNLVANKVMVKVWKRQMQPKGVYLKYTDAEKNLLTYLESELSVNFSTACRVMRTRHGKTENILANFIALGILEPVYEDMRVQYRMRIPGNMPIEE